MAFDVSKLRDWVNNNTAVVTIGAVLILILALIKMTMCDGSAGGGGSGPISVYFWDEKTQELFEDQSDKIPPFTREDTGGNAVRAFVFACGECGGDNEFLGYVEKFTDEYKTAMAKLREASESGGEIPPDAAFYLEEGYSKGRLIKRKDDAEWVESSSEEGIALVKQINAQCQGKGRLRPCYPD